MNHWLCSIVTVLEMGKSCVGNWVNPGSASTLPSFAARFSRGLSDQGIEHLRNKFLFALGQLVDGFQLLLPFRSRAGVGA